MISFLSKYRRLFIIPLIIIGWIVGYFALRFFDLSQIANYLIILTIVIGSAQLMQDTYRSIMNREFALDYLAIIAILVGVISWEYIVAAVIVLMMAGGNALEKYGIAQAKQSLTWLIDRIPNTVTVIHEGSCTPTARESVMIGSDILIKKGEVVPLDGILTSANASIDESSVTGEPYPQDHVQGNIITSGTVNIGETIVITVTRLDADSTYNQIIQLVASAQEDKSPFIRLADRYSVIFTIIALSIAWFAYRLHRDINYVLAVLVIATPCPLILATPIALMWGMSSAARKLIIVKNLTAIEALSRVDALVFDKTGTITLGKPEFVDIEIYDTTLDHDTILALAGSIENNSVHPFAKAIVQYMKDQKITPVITTNIREVVWHSIAGDYQWHSYRLGKVDNDVGMSIGMRKDDVLAAKFILEDRIKSDSVDAIRGLIHDKLQVSVYTGDNAQAANQIVSQIDPMIQVVADCTPQDKQAGIAQLHEQWRVVAMVWDGINDAPALALADVGMVFSNNEQTATTEAADVVFLNGNFRNVVDVLHISSQAVLIAKQAIWFGIGLSTVGMIAASLWYIQPIVWAGLQEVIDVVAILYALKASRL